jgi:predicted SprT family Zn-dependent metalloprotease
MSIEIGRDIQFNRIYEILNVNLFDNLLPTDVHLGAVYKIRAEGQFLPNKQEFNGNPYHEILIDENLIDGDRDYMLGVFVHQMVHLWQWEQGQQHTPKHYHNKEFIAKLKQLGIEATTEDGYKLLTESIHPQGQLAKIIAEHDAALRVTVVPRNAGAKIEMPEKSKNKVTYVCAKCGSKFWGRPGLIVICGTCHADLATQFSSFIAVESQCCRLNER